MTDTLKVVTIRGSLRKNSYNHALLRALPSLAPGNVTFVEAPPYDVMPFYNQDIQDVSGFPALRIPSAKATTGAFIKRVKA